MKNTVNNNMLNLIEESSVMLPKSLVVNIVNKTTITVHTRFKK